MSLMIEKEIEPAFSFAYEKLAEEIVSFALRHEDFCYEADM